MTTEIVDDWIVRYLNAELAISKLPPSQISVSQEYQVILKILDESDSLFVQWPINTSDFIEFSERTKRILADFLYTSSLKTDSYELRVKLYENTHEFMLRIRQD